jgi:hypothetical protein
MQVESILSKHLDLSPSTMTCELFGYASSEAVSKTSGIKAKLPRLFPAAAGLGGPPRP